MLGRDGPGPPAPASCWDSVCLELFSPSSRTHIKASTPQGSLGGIYFCIFLEGRREDSLIRNANCLAVILTLPFFHTGRFCGSLKIYDGLQKSSDSHCAGQGLPVQPVPASALQIASDGGLVLGPIWTLHLVCLHLSLPSPAVGCRVTASPSSWFPPL